MAHPEMLPTMNIGETIRNYRLQKGMSQGDIENEPAFSLLPIAG